MCCSSLISVDDFTSKMSQLFVSSLYLRMSDRTIKFSTIAVAWNNIFSPFSMCCFVSCWPSWKLFLISLPPGKSFCA